MLINGLVAIVAYSSLAAEPWLRYSQEIVAMLLSLVAFGIITWQEYRSPLMLYFRYALVWFAVSSLAFMLASPWNHLWWLAHGIFAGGFTILGYGVFNAYQVNQSFSQVFNEQELLEDQAETNLRLTGMANCHP